MGASAVVNTLAGAAALLFLLQGLSFSMRRDSALHVRWLGGLTLLLIALGCIASALLASGLVFSRELGLVLVEGPHALAALRALLIGTPLVAGLGVQAVRSRLAGASSKPHSGAQRADEASGGPRTPLGPIAAGALVIGVWSALRVRSLGSELGAFCAFDPWWPPLLLWVVLCLVECALTVVQASASSRAWLALGCSAGLALLALARESGGALGEEAQALSAGTDRALWQLALCVGLLGAAGLGAWRLALPPRRRAAALGLACGAAAVVLARALLAGAPLWEAACAWAAIGLAGAPRLARARRERARNPRDFGRPGPWDDRAALAAIAAMLGALLFSLQFDALPLPGSMTLCVLTWLFLLEVVGGGPLQELWSRPALVHIRQSASPGRAFCHSARARAVALLAAAGERLGALFGAESAGGALLKLAFASALLVALSELPNAGRTLVEPFEFADAAAAAAPAAEPKTDGDAQRAAAAAALGKLVSLRSVNTLGLLAQELRPDAMLSFAERGRDESSPLRRGAEPLSDGLGSPSASLESEELEVFGVKLPLRLFTLPILRPMRWLLGVHVIRGAILRANGQYALLASSSDGDTWRVVVPEAHADFAAELGDELAYRVVAAAPGSAITSQWQALGPYRAGLEAWRSYERDHRLERLTEAIARFRDSTRTDPSFALAHYRLGLALVEAREPRAAAEAFEASIAVRPDFAAGQLALASDLAYGIQEEPGAAASESAERAAQTRAERAREIWRAIAARRGAREIDRAAAWFGLCDQAGANAELAASAHAFLLCSLAEKLYRRLPRESAELSALKESRGRALNNLGVALMQLGRGESAPLERWHCRGLHEASRSSLAAAALRYYRAASALVPLDPVIRCNEAEASLALDDPAPMQRLEDTASAHRDLADALGDAAAAADSEGPDASAYQLARAEYARAMELDPLDWRARNNRAYLFRSWRRAHPERALLDVLGEALAAESAAREALRLVVDHGSQTDLAMVASTLAEVLLEQGRPHEAFTVLQAAQQGAPQHALYGEFYWDLANAYICAQDAEPRDGPSGPGELERRAEQTLAEILAFEQGREERRFGGEKSDLAELRRSCPQSLERAAVALRASVPLALRSVARRAGEPLCGRYGVLAAFADGGAGEALQLRFWGTGEAPRAIPLDPGSHTARLSVLPRLEAALPVRRYYARIERAGGEPLSAVHAFDVKPGACPLEVRLEFTASPRRSARAELGRSAPGTRALPH